MYGKQNSSPATNVAIDLRSDTVTKPTDEMRHAMATAEVGDDVYGEDPTVNRLEAMAAEMLGKEAGLFVPSGTMGNLICVLTHCGRGDEMILGNMSHIFYFEQGGSAALGGVHPRTLPTEPDGTLKVDDIRRAIRGSDDHYPITRLIALENTHNRAGGRVLSAEYTDEVGALAHERGLKLHIDGARLWNAAVALGIPPARLVESADSVTCCLSKALGAPVGSVIAGSAEFVRRARRNRKLVGGGMRQAGILAAAGIVALESMIDRLAEDHANARLLARGLGRLPGVEVDEAGVESNMVFVAVAPDRFAAGFGADTLASSLAERGVLCNAIDEQRLRLVLHHHVSASHVEQVLDAFESVLAAGAQPATAGGWIKD